MLSLENQKRIRDQARINGATAQAIKAKLADDVAKIEAQTGLTVEYRRQRVDELRKAAATAIAAPVKAIAETAAALAAQRQHWSNKQLVLSMQRFHPDDDALESMTRLRVATELQHAGPALLTAIVANLRDDLSRATGSARAPLLAKLSACLSAAGAPANLQPNGKAIEISIDDVPLPGQQEALGLITECENLAVVANSLYQEAASGKKPQGAQSLAVARAAMALQAPIPAPTGKPAPAAASR